ncbi:MAG: hypothetical protein FD189_1362 [Elusimicrobia bacterium]|nr:MAG: hypothetical protein FD154_1136 [Elusimicrobiota bacterium]KAF0155562.1 MAG: hypothetical protein FD189_1362 [Elusimicrobiota bacterium]
MRRYITHDSYMKECMADPAEAATYLNVVLEDGDIPFLLKAIRTVAGAQGGMGKLAKAVGMSRTSLYKALSPTGNPGIHTLEAILAVYGVRLGFFPIAKGPRPSAHRSSSRQAHL